MSTENSRAASTDKSMDTSAAGRTGRGAFAGGDLQGAVELPGRARSLGAGVAWHLDCHVDEAVVDGRFSAGEEGPHLASQIGPVDHLVLGGASVGAVDRHVGAPSDRRENLNSFLNGL